MTTTSHLHRALASMAVVALLGACSSTPIESMADARPAVANAGEIPAALPRTGAAGAGGAAANSLAGARAGATSGLSAAAAALAAGTPRERSVYFDFDNYTIDPAEQRKLAAHAKVLVAETNVNVRIEGHADDRGSAEYNLALGQRRAEAVKRALNILGVSDQQLRATSWGEEKPQAPGDNETAWSRNRRAEIVYATN